MQLANHTPTMWKGQAGTLGSARVIGTKSFLGSNWVSGEGGVIPGRGDDVKVENVQW